MNSNNYNVASRHAVFTAMFSTLFEIRVNKINNRQIFFYFRRYVANISLFDELVKLALTLPTSRYGIGGNAPVMAMRLFAEGCQVTLASSLTPKYLNSIPSGIKGNNETPK